MAPARGIGGLASGAWIHVDGLRMLRRERPLWALAAVPLALSALTLGVAVAGLVAYAGELHAFVTSWLPQPTATSLLAWLWVGPAKVALGALGVILFAAVAASAVAVAFLLASVLAAPFLDVLSRRVEAIVTGRVEDVGEGGLRNAVRAGLRATWEELKRTAFFLALQAAIVVAGIVVPGGQVVAPAALAVATMLFLPLDYAGYTLDRHGVAFRARRRWVLERTPLMLGYGAAAFAFHLVPGLNLLLLPVLVSSGTLLALRHPPPAAALTRGRAGSGGRATST